MSIDTQLSKQELSKQLESYINHTIQGQPYDPSQSGCVVQIVSGNPLRIADASNHIDVSDSSNITAKLKEINPNTNWITMRGAALSLKKWGFTSSYDSANDKLKLDIIVDEVDCLQDGGANSPKASELVPLLEDSKLRGKVNRLRKFYMAEELNHLHPVEVALEQIDRERKNTSDMRKMANVNHLRQQEIGASLESDRNHLSFWDEVDHNPERQNPAFHASEPNYEENRIHINRPQYQTMPENMFQNLEGYDSQPNLFQASMQEENIYDLLNQGELSEKKNMNEDQIEIEEEVRIQQEEPLKEVPPAIKRKFFDIVNEKKDSIDHFSKQGSKKLFRGPAIDSAAEQQRLIKARDGKKLTTFQDSGELDTLGLLGASFTQEPQQPQPQIQIHQVKNVFPTRQQQQQPERIYEQPERNQRLYPATRREEEPLKEYNSPSYRKVSPQRVIDEEINEAIAEYERSRSREKERERKESLERQYKVVQQPKQQKQTNLLFKKSTEKKVSKERDDLLEISNNDYLKSFKTVHFAPKSQNELEERRASYANKGTESERKRSGALGSFDDYEEISFREPPRQQQQQQQYFSGKVTPSSAVYVENPFDQRYLIDLNSFQTITFKSATTSGNFKRK